LLGAPPARPNAAPRGVARANVARRAREAPRAGADGRRCRSARTPRQWRWTAGTARVPRPASAPSFANRPPPLARGLFLRPLLRGLVSARGSSLASLLPLVGKAHRGLPAPVESLPSCRLDSLESANGAGGGGERGEAGGGGGGGGGGRGGGGGGSAAPGSARPERGTPLSYRL
jgi:uncharacterized membrane protein YgcG